MSCGATVKEKRRQTKENTSANNGAKELATRNRNETPADDELHAY